jgi:hypothetical protein
MPRKEREPCAFCPATANITGAHLWSDWASKLLSPRKYTIHRDLLDGGPILQWKANALKEKAPVVCGHCNSEWMSDIENATKFVIGDMVKDGIDKQLGAKDIATIAAFLFLKAVVCDHMHENYAPFYDFEQRELFRRTLEIPLGVQMYLGSAAGIRGMFKCSTIRSAGNAGPGMEINVFSFVLGRLVAQLTGTRWMKKSRRKHAFPPRLSQSINFVRASIPIWPNPGIPVSWPPPLHMEGQALEQFVNRWGLLEWKRRISS